MSGPELSVHFFAQMAVILLACRAVGALARRIGQPQVVGEMIAGVLLGPSLLGLLFPKAQAFLFPPESLKTLYVGAQLGVGLYMFLIGVEFDVGLFRSRARSAAAVSIAGMLVPFALAAALAPWLRGIPGLFAPDATTFEAFLFLGAAIAITAFPMLARIIFERGLAGTPLGTLALAAGAIDDAAAWAVLAVVLASFQKLPDGTADWGKARLAVGAGAVYAAAVVFAGRRLLAPLQRFYDREKGMTPAVLGVVLALFAAAAWAMDAAGLHAVFGGFLLGTAMPRGAFAKDLRETLEPFAVVFLLPMFFCFSGLNTRLDVMIEPRLLAVCAVLLAASCLGKGVACWLAARLNGEDNPTALAIGALMNSRALMELIIINIGLQKGIILPPLFAMLVVMAIATTLMATPIFELVYGRSARARGDIGAAAS